MSLKSNNKNNLIHNQYRVANCTYLLLESVFKLFITCTEVTEDQNVKGINRHASVSEVANCTYLLLESGHCINKISRRIKGVSTFHFASDSQICSSVITNPKNKGIYKSSLLPTSLQNHIF